MTKRILFVLIILFTQHLGFAQNISGVINAYASVSAINLNVLTVNSTTGFNVGDKVLIIKMKGATVNQTNTVAYGDTISTGEAGKYTFSTIIAMTNTTMTLSPFCNIFADALYLQVVSVPIYPNPTVTAPLTCQGWNGLTGGVLILETPGTLTLNDDIEGSHLGYRGGDVWGSTFSCGTTNFFSPQGFFGPEGKKGEGVAEYIVGQECGRGKLANGGGGAFGGNGGGAGGANAGKGGNGGFEQNTCPILGNFAYGAQPVTHKNTALLMGGGGGGPQSDSGQAIFNGGNGGAIIYIKANEIVGNGNTINSNGQTTPVINDEASSGAGAGGSVYLDCPTFNTPLTISVIGGNGGSTNNVMFPTACQGTGGGGGGGLVWFAGGATPAGVNVALQGGSGGFVLNAASPCFNTQHNAGDGDPGQIKYNFTPTPPPVLPTLNLGPDLPFCANGSYVLDAGTGYASYLWDDNSTSQIRNVTGTGTYFATVTTFQGCTASDTVIVFADTAIIADFTARIGLGCDNDTVFLNNISSAATTQYAWSFGDGTSSALQNPGYHVFTTQGTYTITLISSNPPCADTTFQVFDLNHPLQAAYQLSGPGVLNGLVADSACKGTAIAVNGAISTPQNTNTLQYNWNWGDGHIVNSGIFPVDGYTYPAAGTYTLTLTITDTLGCTDDTSRTVYVEESTPPTFTVSDDNVCVGEPIIFTASVAPATLNTIWDFNDGVFAFDQLQLMHTFSDPKAGPYQVQLKTQYAVCLDDSVTVPVTVNGYPTINLGPDTSICPGLVGALLLADINNNNAIYSWSTGETASSITITEPGHYWVRATTTNSDCSTIDSIWVKRDCYLNVPNAFSPDGDGQNDFFLPREILAAGLRNFKMSIYNRWGELIFTTEQIDGRGWDGKYNGVLQPLGSYVYVIDAEFANGVKKALSGNVTLIR